MRFEARQPREDVNVSSTSAVGEATTLVAGTVALVVALLLAAFVFVEGVTVLLPPSLEARLFLPLFEDLYDGESRPDERMQALVERLAGHWPESPYSFELQIGTSEEPNAYALPGGAIVVNRGLLERIESENELAFVLAHEIGHFRNRDHIRRIGRGALAELVLLALGAGGAEALPSLISDLTQRGFDRDQESEADAFGLTLVFAEYGHVGGADAFFTLLPDAEADLGEKLSSYFETHPVTAERIAALRALAAERGWPREGPEQAW
jgi:predicted Zn-dependent protease